MGKSWRDQVNRGLNTKKAKKMKTSQCTVCNKKTYQEDCICVLCRNYITRMYEELVVLLTIDKKNKMRKVSLR